MKPRLPGLTLKEPISTVIFPCFYLLSALSLSSLKLLYHLDEIKLETFGMKAGLFSHPRELLRMNCLRNQSRGQQLRSWLWCGCAEAGLSAEKEVKEKNPFCLQLFGATSVRSGGWAERQGVAVVGHGPFHRFWVLPEKCGSLSRHVTCCI